MPAVLPVSGVALDLDEPTGEDELVALRHGQPPALTMLSLAQRLGHDAAGRPLPWLELPAVDLAAAALFIRWDWLGERIRTETICPAAGCGEPIDVSFVIAEYLDHHRPAHVRGTVATDDGWILLPGGGGRFRIPTIEDMVGALAGARGSGWLSERCIQPHDATTAMRRQAERALSRLAPRLDEHLRGSCPACGARVDLFFDPIAYVLAELRSAAGGLYADVHELAFAYRWSEAAILALERRRRHHYVALVRGELALT